MCSNDVDEDDDDELQVEDVETDQVRKGGTYDEDDLFDLSDGHDDDVIDDVIDEVDNDLEMINPNIFEENKISKSKSVDCLPGQETD